MTESAEKQSCPHGQVDPTMSGKLLCRMCGTEVASAAQPAPFPDGWPTVPAITVTLDGRVVMAATTVARYVGKCNYCQAEHVLTVEREVKMMMTSMECTACYAGRVEVWLEGSDA